MNKTSQESKTLTVADRDDAVSRLRHYFGTCECAAPESGAAFETIGHPWDKKSKVNTVSPGDLVALATLTTPVAGPAAVWMLDKKNLKKTEKLLRKIPVKAKIGTKSGTKLLKDGGPAAKLWDHWSQAPGFGPVSVSKLLARKRGKLVPAYGSVVADQMEVSDPGEHWAAMQGLFTDGRRDLWATAKEWRRAAGVNSLVSPLRVIDVVLWSRGTYPDGPPCAADAAKK
ncbi:DUF6308 family protein [Demequina sp. SO4-18]|uniref:DUF6308 family protein n=1 Tax=Demequina sp. SO4-18 TaxID=3401026 RepID=UPI003B5A10B6